MRKPNLAIVLACSVASREASGQEAVDEKPRHKLSKKARLAAKKAEKRAKRGAASDDEDVQPGKNGKPMPDLLCE